MSSWTPTFSEFYDPRLVSIYNAVNPIDTYKQFYLDVAERVDASAVIDLGCGTGLLTCEFATSGRDVFGVEPSRLMLDLARVSNCADEVTWVQGGYEKLGDRGVDLVVMTGMLLNLFRTMIGSPAWKPQQGRWSVGDTWCSKFETRTHPCLAVGRVHRIPQRSSIQMPVIFRGGILCCRVRMDLFATRFTTDLRPPELNCCHSAS